MLTFAPSRLQPYYRLSALAKTICYSAFGAVIAMSSASAQVASGTTGIDASGNASSEMAACKNGKTQQARETCMTEVKNANAAKRAGKLSTSGDFSANALRRCEVFKAAEDQSACRARVMGETEAQGSVAGGGVLRETETVVPAAP